MPDEPIYTTQFDDIFKLLIESEGDSFTDDPQDRGGATKFGLTDKFLDGIHYHKTAFKLTLEDAKFIYHEHIWQFYRFDRFPDMVGRKLFDMTVLSGPKIAGLILQRALNLLTKLELDEDGVIGPATTSAANLSAQPEPLLVTMRAFYDCYLRKVVERLPQQQKWMRGWRNRNRRI